MSQAEQRIQEIVALKEQELNENIAEKRLDDGDLYPCIA